MSLTLTWALGFAIPAALICLAVYDRAIRPRRDTFENGNVLLTVDPTTRLLRVQSCDTPEVAFKLGCCVIALNQEAATIVKSSSTSISRVLIYELDVPTHFHKRWIRHPSVTLTPAATRNANFAVPSSDVTALQRWMHAHRTTLFPNEHAIRQAWEQSCERLLTACRQVTMIQKLKTPLELFDYTPTPAIRYLAIGEDGRACLKALECTKVHELDLRDLQLNRFRLWVKLPNGKKERFTLNGSQLAHLCRIRRGWRNRYGLLPEYETQLLMRRSLAIALTGIRQYAGVRHVPA